MEEIHVLLERHDQNIQILQKQVTDLYQVQKEIRAMNETLITLANEIKHANEHLARHEEKIDEIGFSGGKRYYCKFAFINKGGNKMNFEEYITPELLILIPVVYAIGAAAKKSRLPDRWIPLGLGGISIVLAAIWVLSNSTLDSWQAVLAAVFSAVTQGILIAAASVYISQLYIQANKEE